MIAPSVRRDHCVVCGAAALDPFLTVQDFPIFQGCVTFPKGMGEVAPMPWAACESCGSAQISELPPLDRIYQGGHATGLGRAWARHHAAFARFIGQHARGEIVDVGGGSGTLAAAYRQNGGAGRWTILEPNALPSAAIPRDVEIVDGFLERDTLRRIAAQTIVMCHMLEHVTDLRATLQDLTDIASVGTRIIVAWPVLEEWTARGLAGALNFEHGIYLTLMRLERLFAAFGWRLAAQALWSENDTAFLAFERGRADTAETGTATSARAAVMSYFAGFTAAAEKLNVRLRALEGEAFLMPASIYAQMLIASGLPEARLSALLDNAEVKQGRRLFGTGLSVRSPHAALASARRPLVVINGGAHEFEMAAHVRSIRQDALILRGDGSQLAGAA